MIETAEFCEIIRKWWDIVNTKSTIKGLLKRNEYCKPMKLDSDISFNFLEKFITWLEIWNNSVNNIGILSKDTFEALVLTTKSILNIVKFSLTELQLDYFLVGKLQTDDLESRFRLYRSMAGCNYKVSYTEVIESEKKIRIHNVFTHNKKDYTKLIQNSNDNSLHDDSYEIADFDTILNSNFYLENAKAEDSSYLYVNGYASNKALQDISCESCRNLILKEKGMSTKYTYFNFLQKGGLSVASDEVGYILFHMSAIFQEILRQKDLKCKYLLSKNQKAILIDLTVNSLKKDDECITDIDLDHECDCGASSFDIYFKICKTFANILLNNYIKEVNDLEHRKSGNTNRKILNFK